MIEVALLSFLRSIFWSTPLVIIALFLAKCFNFSRGKKKVFIASLVLIPLTVPPLLPAYVYSSFSINFQTQPLLNEILYGLILLSRTLPWAFIVILAIPCRMRESAAVCESLLSNKKSFRLPDTNISASFAVSALIIFHDYELASLLRIKHWTVSLFNAHAGGLVLNLTGSFMSAVTPLILSILMIIIFTFSLKKSSDQHYSKTSKSFKSACALLVSLLGISTIIPLAVIFSESGSALFTLFQGGWLLNEIGNSLLISIICTVCCLMFIFGINKQNSKIALAIAIPGLFGALLTGLFYIALFNVEFLSSLKNTALPFCLGLITLGCPIALITILINSKNKSDTIQLLPQKNTLKVKWLTSTKPFLISTIPLYCFVWFDLTLSSMLAPASVNTLFPRLYNLMHYSENEKLSASVLVASIIPFILYILLYLLCKLTLIIRLRGT